MRRGTRTRRDGGERRRGRVALLIGVYVLWGMLLTWIVAWTAAGVVSPWIDGRWFDVIDTERFPPAVVDVRVSFGATSAVALFDASDELLVAWDTRRAFGEDRTLPGFANDLVPGIHSSDSPGTCAILAAGWPWRAFAYRLGNEDPENVRMLLLGRDFHSRPPHEADPNPTGALRLTSGYFPSREHLPDDELWFPYLPLWRGLIANTLFYALLLWLLRRGFVFGRGQSRRRKGRCGWRGGCGYDLSGSVGEVCPECGRPAGEGSRGDAAGAAAG